MSKELRQALRNPLFIIGLAVRCILIVCALPRTQSEWFIPFLQGTARSISLDPWTTHLLRAGDPMAFPYGPVMLLAYLPGVALGSLFDGGAYGGLGASIGFGFTTLLFDLVLFVLLRRLLRCELRQIILFYWISPVVLYIGYWHGQCDIVPICLLVSALLALREIRPRAAGVLLGLAVASKLSMLLAVPFLLVYLWRNSRLRSLFIPFTATLALTILCLQVVCLLSPGFLTMVTGSPEIRKIYNVAIDLGAGLKVYLLPLIYTVLLYGAWRIERMSADLLFALLGIVFFAVLVLTPASSGWYLWVIPFLVGFQVRADKFSALLGWAFSLCFVVTNVLFASGALLRPLNLDLRVPLVLTTTPEAAHLHSLMLTLTCATAILIALRMFIHGVQRSDYFRLSRRPLAIGIAGDSGSGKDTMALALAGLFGEQSVTSVSGDDYHKWDRAAPMWQAVTHLDPRANDLHQFTRDVLALLDGKSVLSRHYDHRTGRFSREMAVRKNDVLIVSGLHVFYLPQLRSKIDVKIFLRMDEGLRNFFKIQRDVGERGRPVENVVRSIERRQPDADRFIRPQIADADVVFSLMPADPDLENAVELSRYKLHVSLRSGVFYEDLLKLLIGLCGMHVDFQLGSDGGAVELVIAGDVTAEDIALAGQEIRGDIEELMGLNPRWHGGMLGVMQLVTLCQICDSLRTRMLQ